MYYSPHSHLELARARQDDLLREARRRELARSAPKRERRGLFARLGRRRPAAQAAPQPGC
jgi:hypothetical protein